MRTPTRGASWVLAVTGTLLLMIASGCSAPRLPDCRDFVLSESAVAAGEKVDVREFARRSVERGVQQQGWLALRLSVEQEAVGYTEPVAFRLVITNEADHEVVFLRPKTIMLRRDMLYISDLIVELVSSAGTRFSSGAIGIIDVKHPWPAMEDFSVLRPGASCSVDLRWVWNETRDSLQYPPPPGDYRMKVVMEGHYVGPDVGPVPDSEEHFVDVGAWVGTTEPSNEVSFTIRPPDE